jgi:hypothetical protein
VALAILQSHRDVLIRYLKEFDEVLKYANDLSGTVRLLSLIVMIFQCSLPLLPPFPSKNNGHVPQLVCVVEPC